MEHRFSDTLTGADYAPVPTGMTIEVASGQTLNVYAAKAGYNNSDISTYTNP